MNKLRALLRSFRSDFDLMELVKGGSIFFVVKILGTIGAYAFSLLVFRYYGPEGNGTFAFIFTVAIILSYISNMGLNTYAVKIIPHFTLQSDGTSVYKFFNRSLGLITTVGIGIYLLVKAIGLSLPEHSPLQSELHYSALLTFPLAVLLFTSAALKASKRIVVFSLLQHNILQFAAFLILLLPIWGRTSDTEPVISIIIAAIGFTLLGLFRWFAGRKPLNEGSLSDFRFSGHIQSAFPMLVGGIAFFILNLTDRMMLRLLDSTENLGIYDVTLRISNLTLFGLLSLNAIAEPKFAELYAKKDMPGLKKFVQHSTLIGLGITIPVLLVITLFPDFWLGMFGHGEEYLKGRRVLYFLVAGNIFSCFCGGVLNLLNMIGYQKSVQKILLISAFFNVVLNFILIPVIGINGAALATMIATIIWNIWAFQVVYRRLGFSTIGFFRF